MAGYYGFGLKEKFLKYFYINESIEAGIEYNSKTIDYGDINCNIKEHDYNPDLIFKIGLGYTIDYKSKPLSDIDKIFYQK
jgi:hypothetical protein